MEVRPEPDNPQIPISEREHRFHNKIEHNSTFDFIVVGAGSAGCVCASELAKANCSVLLIEAGEELQNSSLIRIPRNSHKLWRTEADWHYNTVPQKHLNNKILPAERGKTLGGSSSINHLIYVRGSPEDYNRFAYQYGLGEDWSYKSVLTEFKELEKVDADRLGLSSSTTISSRGTNGELEVNIPYPPKQDAVSFVNAGVEAGYARNIDYNGSHGQAGFSLSQHQVSPLSHRRQDAFNCFCEPICRKDNFHILSNTFVRKVLLNENNNKTIGIEIEQFDEIFNLYCAKEIVLSAGSINTPQILQLSGIGPRKELNRLDIPCKVDLQGVGRNLQDHPSSVIAFMLKPEVSLNTNRELEYAAVQSLGYIQSPSIIADEKRDNIKYGCDLQLNLSSGFVSSTRKFFTPIATDNPELWNHDKTLIRQILIEKAQEQERLTENVVPPQVIAIVVMLNLCRSRGQLTLNSNDPHDKPNIDPNMFENENDLNAMMHGLREAYKISQQPSLQKIIQQATLSKEVLDNDDLLKEYLRKDTGSTWHHCGTCCMGDVHNNPNAVCDSKLKVKGIDGLRIADASVLPFCTSGNINTAILMIGKKCGKYIVSEYGSGMMKKSNNTNNNYTARL